MRTYMTVEIELSKKGKKYAGQFVAIVDDCDAELALLNWQIQYISNKQQYVVRRTSINGETVVRQLHRVIMEKVLGHAIPDGMFIDHISGDGLDNRRENLRLATHSQNIANSRKRKNSQAPYRGVMQVSKSKYRAKITCDGKRYDLGKFDSAEEARDAYQAKAAELFGDFANFGTAPIVTRTPDLPSAKLPSPTFEFRTVMNIRAEIVKKAKAQNAELYAVEQAQIEKRNAALLRQITELSEIAETHKNPYIAEVARKRLHKLTIQAIRYGLRFAIEGESAAWLTA